MLEPLVLFALLVAAPAFLLISGLPKLRVGGSQWLGTLYGVAGALILAMPGVAPAWGFAAFLVSNVAWLIFGASDRLWGLVVQQSVFLVASLIGIWNWWLGPLVLG
ncbi:hypothetical protein [uncultured Pseudacidovorax sp.]|uniref:hypothetical protein n=1 Tax=uncultured Pseudacidovorax sp. TaxID=679313 RepID=UPI0025D9040E|nr:hypothetical protein [uncultured Pseudacidovorax sp.]